MPTGIGDLVATLSVDKSNWSAGLSEARGEVGELGGEVETHVGGASRAFEFLGKSIKEGGEALGEHNAQLGGAVSGFGELTGGIGEAVHGYHALHTVIELATVAQVALNAVSPLGWAVMIGGAAAAAAGYLLLKNNVSEATAEQKKFQEEAGKKADSGLAAMREELAKLTSTPLERIAEQMREAGRSSKEIAEATAQYAEQLRTVQYLKAADKAHSEVGSEMEHLRDEIEKTKPPLDQLQDKLKQAGAGASEIAKTTDEFKKMHAELDQINAAKELQNAEFKQSLEGKTEGQKFAENFRHENPNATRDQQKEAAHVGQKMDDNAVKQLVDGINKKPGDTEIEEIKRIRESAARGGQDPAAAAAAEAKLTQQYIKDTAGDEKDIKPAEQPKAEEKDSNEAWQTILGAQSVQQQQLEQQKKQTEALENLQKLLQPKGRDDHGQEIDFS